MINEGVSFGLFPGVSALFVLLVWLIVGYLLLKEKTKLGKLGLVFIMVGGGMNLWERVKNGWVIDNFNFLGLVYNNLADYLIAIGLIIYGYSSFVRRQRDSSN